MREKERDGMHFVLCLVHCGPISCCTHEILIVNAPNGLANNPTLASAAADQRMPNTEAWHERGHKHQAEKKYDDNTSETRAELHY